MGPILCIKCNDSNLDRLNYGLLKLDCGHKICDKCILYNINENTYMCNVTHKCYHRQRQIDSSVFIKVEDIDKMWACRAAAEEENYNNKVDLVIQKIYSKKIKNKELVVSAESATKYGDNFCLAAIGINNKNIKVIPNDVLSDNILYNALKKKISLLGEYHSLIKDKRLYLSLIDYNPKHLREICNYVGLKLIIKYILFKNAYKNLKYIKKSLFSDKVINYIAEKNHDAFHTLSGVIDVPYNSYLRAVETGYSLERVPEKYKNAFLCFKAVLHDGMQIKHLPQKHNDIMLTISIVAARNSAESIKHIPKEYKDKVLRFLKNTQELYPSEEEWVDNLLYVYGPAETAET